jgi:hypothetical protein
MRRENAPQPEMESGGWLTKKKTPRYGRKWKMGK